MSDDVKYYYVNKLDLELAIDEAVYEVFFDDVVKILPKLIWNTSNEKNFKRYILKRLPDHDWSTLKEKQDKNGGIIQASQGDRERSDDSDTSDTEITPPITISSRSTAADKSKSVVTPEAPDEEIDISFTEEDQSAHQLHITKADQPKTDKETPSQPSSTPEKGKTLGRTDKQSDIYGEDKANYIVTGFLPSPQSTAV
ncbi:hypothetical protein RCL_jg24068.t1 [Rhizophagus clarus]|uniref:Uncharacterized protein n=1 Tax=Rhizophagus clarus TaxID=94130 RepID=A0A8H3QRE0_9GLOM|nr:hypothetical protein RCL_jg24068.t1 [Rhizophagus clarus]